MQLTRDRARARRGGITPPMKRISARIPRRQFLGNVALGATALGLGAGSARAAAAEAVTSPTGRKPVKMKAGHQHDHSETTLRALAAFGVTHICSGHMPAQLNEEWSVDGLTRLR